MTGQDRSEKYYAQGSDEVASETPLTMAKLAQRRNLTRNSERLVIVLVGLPARGKSFISRKMYTFLNWGDHKCKIFNVGRYRREAVEQMSGDQPQCDAAFFDSKNEKANQLRQRVAELALRDMLKWLDGEMDHVEKTDTQSATGSTPPASPVAPRKTNTSPFSGDRIAIYDATNSTNERRDWILEQCTAPHLRPGKPTGVVFVESICDDEELLRQNYRFKISSSPDFDGMPIEEALEDLRKRVSKYEEQYETITNEQQSYIKIFNLSSKVMVNHIYGRMAKVIVPAIMAWNVGTRPIFLCRPGKTPMGERTDDEDYVCGDNSEDNLDSSASNSALRRQCKGEKLGPEGIAFRQKLGEFIYKEGMEFLRKQEEIASHPSLYTGTSQTGLSSYRHEVGCDNGGLPFPCTMMTSTLPRAAETVSWEDNHFPVHMNSNLNPLDKGDFCGIELEEIQTMDPKWYKKLESDTFGTRFPGGESYRDLIGRLEPVIIDIEQQIAPVLLVSHVSVLQSLMAYFRQSPADQCMSIEVPLHTVIKFTPSRGGGWVESRHPLLPDQQSSPKTSASKLVSIQSESELSALSCSDHLLPSTPIWGDHKRALHRRADSEPIHLPAL